MERDVALRATRRFEAMHITQPEFACRTTAFRMFGRWIQEVCPSKVVNEI